MTDFPSGNNTLFPGSSSTNTSSGTSNNSGFPKGNSSLYPGDADGVGSLADGTGFARQGDEASDAVIALSRRFQFGPDIPTERVDGTPLIDGDVFIRTGGDDALYIYNGELAEYTLSSGFGEFYGLTKENLIAVLTDSEGVRTEADFTADFAAKQQRVDGVFFVSTAAQRLLDPPVGELALYSDINGTPVREHTQAMVVRGIRGVGTAFEVGDGNETIIYDEIEIVENSGDAVLYVTQSLTAGQQRAARSNIGAQQTVDGVFLASTAAQRALNPPIGELAFYANVGGTPTKEQTQGLLVRGIQGVGDAVHLFNDDNDTRLWFETEFVGAGSGTVIFATSDDWEAQTAITLSLNSYISTNADYNANQANRDLTDAGYEAGDEFFITSRDETYQVIITNENLALQIILTDRDSIARLVDGQEALDNISTNTTNITTNVTNIEALTQHNHEQDARIAALENQDFTTTISEFTPDATLSSFFTSGTVTNKGTSGSNLYEAWTVTREGHELIGYEQFTDTERDSFRNEFSLIQGSSSNIYVPANPDAPHTVGIKACFQLLTLMI